MEGAELSKITSAPTKNYFHSNGNNIVPLLVLIFERLKNNIVIIDAYFCISIRDTVLSLTRYFRQTKLPMQENLIYLVGSVAERVKAPFLWRPCDHNRVI